MERPPIDEIANAYENGESLRSLTKRLHCKAGAVRTMLVAYGVQIRTKGEAQTLVNLARAPVKRVRVPSKPRRKPGPKPGVTAPITFPIADAVREYESGESLAALARRYKTGCTRMRRVLEAYGVRIRTKEEALAVSNKRLAAERIGGRGKRESSLSAGTQSESTKT